MADPEAAMPNDMGDMEPMLDDKKPEEMMEKKDGPQPGEYVEDGSSCFCCSTKCGIITSIIFLIIFFCFELLEMIVIFDNEYFDSTYGVVFALILVILFVAVVLGLIYLFGADSPGTRALIPWCLLVGAIAAFLLAFWACIYICGMYDHDKVYVQGKDGDDATESKSSSSSSDSSSDEPKKKHKYSKQSKVIYLIYNAGVPLLFGLILVLDYFTAKAWVSRHANQERAYG